MCAPAVPSIEEFGRGVVEFLVGEVQDGKLRTAIKEQVEADVKETIAETGMEEGLEELREQVATAPPRRSVTPSASPALLLPQMNGPAGYLMSIPGLPNPYGHQPGAIGAQLDGDFESFGDFLKATILSDLRGVEDERLLRIGPSAQGLELKGELTGQELELGGALVPEEFRPDMLMMMLQPANIRPRCMVIPMGAPVIHIPAIADEDHSGGTVFGGVKFEWLEVNDEISATDPEFAMIDLNARALAGSTNLPNTLIADSFISVEALIYRLWGMAVPWMEESEFLRGHGAGKPLGILNSDPVVKVLRQTANQISIQDIANMEAALLPSSSGRAVWMIHPKVRGQLMTLTNGAVQAWHPRVAEGMPDTLNGRPILINEHMGDLGAEADIALVDWMYYVIGDRQALSMAASVHARFRQNQTVLRGIERLDAQPWLKTSVTPAQGSDPLSPFIVLDDGTA